MIIHTKCWLEGWVDKMMCFYGLFLVKSVPLIDIFILWLIGQWVVDGFFVDYVDEVENDLERIFAFVAQERWEFLIEQFWYSLTT